MGLCEGGIVGRGIKRRIVTYGTSVVHASGDGIVKDVVSLQSAAAHHYGVSLCDGGPAGRVVVCSLAKQTKANLGHFSLQELANLAWAFGRAVESDMASFSTLASE